MKNKKEKMFSGYRDLKVYQLAFETAMGRLEMQTFYHNMRKLCLTGAKLWV